MAEIAITGSKLGWSAKDFARLAHDKDLMTDLLMVVRNRWTITIQNPLWLELDVGGKSLQFLLDQLIDLKVFQENPEKFYEEYRRTKEPRVYIYPAALKHFRNGFTASRKGERVSFTRVTHQIINPTNKLRPREFLAPEHLTNFGLEQCTQEDALRLRIAYNDQPYMRAGGGGEQIFIGTQPIGEWKLFGLERIEEDGMFLEIFDTVMGINDSTEFVLRIKKA